MDTSETQDFRINIVKRGFSRVKQRKEVENTEIFRYSKQLKYQKCHLPSLNPENSFRLTQASVLAAEFASMPALWRKAKQSGTQYAPAFASFA